MPQRPSFTLLTRPGCDLCEEFEEALYAHDPTIRVDQADVDSRPDWRERYGLRIPVLLDAAGVLICEGHFDPARLS